MLNKLKNWLEKEPELYEATVECYNCDTSIKLTIPKKTTVTNYMRIAKCFNCECYLMP